MKTRYCLTLMLFCLVMIDVYGQAKSTPRKSNFDQDWKFSLADGINASAENFKDADWRVLDLPHDWSIEGNFDPKHPMGNDGGYLPAGIGWYRKNFKIPAADKGKKITIYFEGVYMNSEIFINGQSVGFRPYGYSSFYYDITRHIKFGVDNTIAVKVDNSMQKNCRWYSGSGIYRHVWLIKTNPVHLDEWATAITASVVNSEKAEVTVKTLVKNETSLKQTVKLRVQLFDNKNKVVASREADVTLAGNSSQELLKSVNVKSPKLWAPETPNMYKARLSLQDGTKQTDNVDIPFGIRSIAYNASQGFLLNGKPVTINGGCVHHDNGILGAAAYDRAEVRKVELLKAAGFNAMRTSHNPPSESFLHACDSLGLIVMDESFDGWREAKTKYDYAMYFDQWWQKDIGSMVLRDRNHPSILFWSTGNEIIERKKAEAIETGRKLADLVRTLDGSRPVTSAMTTWDKQWEIFDPLFAVHDIGGYNYQIHHAIDDHIRVPSRVIVQTESYPRDAFKNWKLVNEQPYIIGDFVWTAMDYLGESGIGRYYYTGETEGEHYQHDQYPWHGAYCGDIDITGWRKPISHYRNMLYNNDKKLYLAVKEPNGYYGEIKETLWSVWPTWESWTWPGHEGKNIDVEVYSRYPKVRLYLNGRKIGEKATSEQEEFKAVFTISYETGELKATGLINGKEVEFQTLKTAGEPAKIKLTGDKKIMSASGGDLCYVAVEIMDSKGVFQPNAENKLSFEVSGPATIAAVGNANLKDTDPYVANERKAWKGRALVVLKSKRTKGNVVLKVTSSGLKSAALSLQCL